MYIRRIKIKTINIIITKTSLGIAPLKQISVILGELRGNTEPNDVYILLVKSTMHISIYTKNVLCCFLNLIQNSLFSDYKIFICYTFNQKIDYYFNNLKTVSKMYHEPNNSVSPCSENTPVTIVTTTATIPKISIHVGCL